MSKEKKDIVTVTENRLPTMPTDPYKLPSYLNSVRYISEAAKAKMSEPNLPAKEYHYWNHMASAAGEMSLRAARKLGDAIRNIETHPGRRTDLEPDSETTEGCSKIRTKQEIITQDFKISETKARKMEQLTDTAVQIEINRAKKDDDIPSLDNALAYIEKQRKSRATGQKNTEVFEQRTTVNFDKTEGFDIAYVGVDCLDKFPEIKCKLNENALVFVSCLNDDLDKAMKVLDTLQCTYTTNAIYIPNQPYHEFNLQKNIGKKTNMFTTSHSMVVVGTKGEPIKITGSAIPSVFREIEVDKKDPYVISCIQHAWPQQSKLNLVSDDTGNSNKTWTTITTTGENNAK